MEKLFVFNGGGTLIDSEYSGFRLLAIEFGKKKEMLSHLKKYEKTKTKGPWGLDKLAELLEGVSKKEIQKAAKKIAKEKLMEGAKKLVKKLKKLGYTVIFCSSDPWEVAEAIRDKLDLDDILGNVLEYKKGIATGKLIVSVDRFDRSNKIKFLKRENKLERDDIIIVGNSVSALPSKNFGKLVSFNSKDKELDVASNIVIKEKDLMELLQYID